MYKYGESWLCRPRNCLALIDDGLRFLLISIFKSSVSRQTVLVDSLAAVCAEICLSTPLMLSQLCSWWRWCYQAALKQVLSKNDGGKWCFIIGWCQPISSNGAVYRGESVSEVPATNARPVGLKCRGTVLSRSSMQCCWWCGVQLSLRYKRLERNNDDKCINTKSSACRITLIQRV